MAQDLGHPSEPPADLAARVIPMSPVAGAWWRIGRTIYNPITFSDDPGWRFSAKTMPGTMYLGEQPEVCFWEVFWDDLAARPEADRRLDDAKVEARSLWQLTLPRQIDVIDTMNPETLNAISAHGGTFLGPYEVCQRWAAALRVHHCGADGILYESVRQKGRRCLALFAETMENAGWSAPGTGTPLKAAPALSPLLQQHGIRTLRTGF